MKQQLKFYGKIFALSVLPSFLFFGLIGFPYSELSHLVTTQIAKQTNNQVLLEFDELSFQFFPALGLKLKGVDLRGRLLPELKMERLDVSPSLMGLLAFKPGVRVFSEGLFGGNVLLNTKGAEQNANGVLKHQVALELEKLLLDKLLSSLNLPLQLSGKIDLQASGVVDPSFTDEPNVDLKAKLQPLRLAGGSIDTGVMGEIELRPLEFRQANLSAQWKSNKLRVQELKLGSSGDALEVKISGQIDLRLQAGPMGPMAKPGPYDFDIELSAGSDFERDFGLYLNFIDQYKREQGNRKVYKFNVNGLSFRTPPNMKAL